MNTSTSRNQTTLPQSALDSGDGRRDLQSNLDITICTLERFPEGAAHSLKVGLVARALHFQGHTVRIFALDATEKLEDPRNKEVQGLYHGVPFEYTAGRTTRARSLILRNWLKFSALVVALWRVRKKSKRNRVMIFYVHDAARLFFMLPLCRLMGIRTVIDLCEWMPTQPDPSLANRFGYETGAIFRLVDGVIPISSLLEQRLRSISGSEPPSFYLSNLIDPTEFTSLGTSPEHRPYILWAGSLDEYKESVRFILQALAQVHQTHPEVLLVLCGGGRPETRAEMLAYAAELNLPADRIVFPGFVTRAELLSYYGTAAVLLAPLENDERSAARFPFKLGEYLLTGRPVVSSRVGDIPNYLVDKVNALVAEPENVASFAGCIRWLLENPARASEIGREGATVVHQHFDFRIVGPRLTAFLESLLSAHPQHVAPAQVP